MTPRLSQLFVRASDDADLDIEIMQAAANCREAEAVDREGEFLTYAQEVGLRTLLDFLDGTVTVHTSSRDPRLQVRVKGIAGPFPYNLVLVEKSGDWTWLGGTNSIVDAVTKCEQAVVVRIPEGVRMGRKGRTALSARRAK